MKLNWDGIVKKNISNGLIVSLGNGRKNKNT